MNISSVPPGYWRLDQRSAAIVCPYSSACPGGSSFGNALCEEPFYGTLCAQVHGHTQYFDLTSQDLLDCSTGETGLAFLLAIATGLLLLFVSIFVVGGKSDRLHTLHARVLSVCGMDSMAKYLKSSSGSTDPDDCESALEPEARIYKRSTKSSSSTSSKSPTSYTGSRGMRWLGLLKIVVSHLQIVCSLAATFRVTFPSVSVTLLRAFAHMSLWTVPALPWRCVGLSAPLTAFTQFSTSLPLLLAVVVLLVALVQYELVQIVEHVRDHTQRRGLLAMRTASVLYLLYFVSYGNALHLSFEAFRCVNLDPTDAVVGDHQVLWSDPSVSCASADYYYTSIWAGLVAALYCFVIPAVYFWLLYTFRESAAQYQLQAFRADGVAGSHSLAVLFSVYRVDRLFFEAWDLALRLAFLGVLPVAAQGDHDVQVGVGLTLAAVHLCILCRLRPYAEASVQTLAETAAAALLAVLLACWWMRLDAMRGGGAGDGDGDGRLDTLVVAALLAPLLALICALVCPRRVGAMAAPPTRAVFVKEPSERRVQRQRSTNTARATSKFSRVPSRSLPPPPPPMSAPPSSNDSGSDISATPSSPRRHRSCRHRREGVFGCDEDDVISLENWTRRPLRAVQAPLPFPQMRMPLPQPPPSPDSSPVSSAPPSPRSALVAAAAHAYSLFGLEQPAVQRDQLLHRLRDQPPVVALNLPAPASPRRHRRGSSPAEPPRDQPAPASGDEEALTRAEVWSAL